MKKTISILLAVCLLLVSAPFAAVAAENANGTTGDCQWSFTAADNTLTVSGSGAMADYYPTDRQPWVNLRGDIQRVVIAEGVTHIGDGAFAECGSLESVSLPEDGLLTIGSESFMRTGLYRANIPEGVTKIGANAFRDCADLAYASFPATLTEIGRTAFLGTALPSVTLPNRNTDVAAYAFGFDDNGNKLPYFTLYGYAKSSAETYSRINSFAFIDIETKQYPLKIYMGRARNLSRGGYTDKAYAGERIQIDPHPDPYYKLTGYTSTDAELEYTGGKWYFTMPEHSVMVYIEGGRIDPLIIDLSETNQVGLTAEQYAFLADELSYFSVGSSKYDLDENGTADIRLADSSVYRLSSASVTGSFAMDTGREDFDPVCIVFAPYDRQIDNARLYMQLPEAGDSYDWSSDTVDIEPLYGEHFTVAESHWYNEWGVAPDRFEGGSKYFAEMILVPENGYAFTPRTWVTIDGDDRLAQFPAKVRSIDTEGRLHVYTENIYIPGEEHDVHIIGGIASEYSGNVYNYRAISKARAGDRVWVNVGTEDIGEDEYVVQGSINYESDEVYFEGEAEQYFTMPDEDVYVTLTYETRKSYNCVMDLRNNAVYKADSGEGFTGAVTSQQYGIYMVLFKLSEDHEYSYNSQYNKGIYQFDVDGNGSFDIGEDGDEFFLLSTSSLNSPTGQIELILDREDSMTVPMRSLTVIFGEPNAKKHTVTVRGGGASLSRGYKDSVSYLDVYPGKTVYITPDIAQLGSDKYVVQRTMTAVSDDVAISDEGETCFVMPDKDVFVDVTYETETQTAGVMDLRTGVYTASKVPSVAGRAGTTEAYGMYIVLERASGRSDSYWDNELNSFVFFYDIDNYGGFDIKYVDSTATFTLMNGHSLRPASGRVTLELTREETYTVPMRRLTIMMAGEDSEQQTHKITVNGGFASSVENNSSYIIDAEYQGQEVFILPDYSAIPEGKYVKKVTVTSNDAEIIQNEASRSFIMPDHDVTVNVSFAFGARSPITLDLSKGEKTVSTATTYNSITKCLEYGSAVSSRYYDEQEETWIGCYDIEGDGKTDIRAADATMSFRLTDENKRGYKTLTFDSSLSYGLQKYPLTVVFSSVLKGDVNGDGTVNIADATALQRHLAEFDGAVLDLANQTVKKRADVNEDGIVDVKDVTAVQRIIAEMA